MAVCGLRCIDLNNDTLETLDTHFSYDKKLKEEKNIYKTVTDIQQVLNIWKMRNLTLEGKIIIFKTITISNIVFQLFITTVPKHVINKLEKIQKTFLWKNSTPKIKHEIIFNDYKTGGIKNDDIRNKIIALECFWIRRLYNNSFHEWKLIPLYLIEKTFGRSFKFHSNLLFKGNKKNVFPSFYQEIILYWKNHLAMMTEIPSCILSQYLWYNANIQIDKISIHFSWFLEKNMNYVSQLFDNNGSIKKWHKFKREYNLHQNSYFHWVQLIDSITEKWKFIIKKQKQ